VSRVEALRCWRNAATLSLQILSHFGKQGTGADVCKSPLLHSSPCTHVTHKVRALMDALLPAMLAVHGLAHADGLELAALALAERRQADLGPPSSSPGWLSRSSHVVYFCFDVCATARHVTSFSLPRGNIVHVHKSARAHTPKPCVVLLASRLSKPPGYLHAAVAGRSFAGAEPRPGACWRLPLAHTQVYSFLRINGTLK
jgi:hypothetical protein